MNLRSTVSRHSLFGEPCELPQYHLPSNREVGQAYLKEKQFATEPLPIVSRRVATKVIAVWNEASIPIISVRGVERQLERYIADAQKAVRSTSLKNRAKIEETIYCLFDICSCKCLDLKECNCPLQDKVMI